MTSEFLTNWLEQAAVSFGVIACGICGSDKVTAARTSHELFTEPKIEETMQLVGEMVDALRAANVATQRLCWTFEQNRVHCATRDDGSFATLIVAREFDTGPMVDFLLTEFHHAV
jgi:hypothetical protein